MDKMEQMLVHDTFRYHFLEIYSFKFLKQKRIKIIGLPAVA